MARPPLSALLDRFRRGVAVPAAVADDLSAELAPVFASLERFELEAQEIRRLSLERAEERAEVAHERAGEIYASWREEAKAASDRAAEEVRRRTRAEQREIEAVAGHEADRIRSVAATRVPGLVAEILACVEEGAA
jgi:vacuolar-type H+-ATPase subunit H